MQKTCPNCSHTIPLEFSFRVSQKTCPNCQMKLVPNSKARMVLAVLFVFSYILLRGTYWSILLLISMFWFIQPLIGHFIGYELYKPNTLQKSKGIYALTILYSILIIFAGGYFLIMNQHFPSDTQTLYLSLVNLLVFYLFQILLFILIKFELFRKILSNPKAYIGYIVAWILFSMIVFSALDMMFFSVVEPYFKSIVLPVFIVCILLIGIQNTINKRKNESV